MTQKLRMRIAVLAMICTAFLAPPALAAGPQALSPWDAARYVAAFDAAERGDFVDSELKASEVKDAALIGHLAFRQLMHPTAHKASFQELSAWLAKYADLPVAGRVYALAVRRKPADAKPAPAPLLASGDWARIETAAQTVAGRLPSDRGRQAREAFYAGDVKRALALAPAAGERWIAGLAAYRLKQYPTAEGYFAQVAQNEREDVWLRAAGAYWAARSASAAGDAAKAAEHLRAAAAYPNTFYGMIAERQARMQTVARPQQLSESAPQGELVLAAYNGPTVGLARFVKADPRAHRAAALAQIGRPVEAGLELRAGLTLAKTEAEREQWTALILALNAPLSSAGDARPTAARRAADPADYPTPTLEPKSGFTIDKALVYAIVRQESRFNPMAISPSGAVGLMQLMPEAAARAAGDDKLKADMSPLFDPAFNLRVGQDYVTWLMERGVGYDILRAVAAYNGGPGTLLKTAAQLGEEADSLLLIECLPAMETRNYVEKVMAGYWTYRTKFGRESPTLEALAQGAKFIDARLDK